SPGTTVDAIANSTVFATGQRMLLGVTATNAAGNPAADLYVGVILPDGETMVFFSAPGVVGGTIRLYEAHELRPMQTVAAAATVPPARASAPPGPALPAGNYQFVAALVPHGVPADVNLGANLLAADAHGFTFVSPADPDPAVSGRWTIAQILPLIPIHMHL